MSKLKTKLSEFSYETGKAIYVYKYKQHTFVGEASCHEDDMDMCSELVGLKLAESRAFLKYLKVRKVELIERLSTLKGVLLNLSTSKDFNSESKYAKKLMSMINEIQSDLEDCKMGLENIPQYIKQDIEARDKLYQAIRKRRAGESYKVNLFTIKKEDV